MAAEAIDAKIKGLGDWRGDTLAKLRALIRAADPEVEETVKWQKPSNPAGVPVWDHQGILCPGETDKDKVKVTFTKGAAPDGPEERVIEIKVGSTTGRDRGRQYGWRQVGAVAL